MYYNKLFAFAYALWVIAHGGNSLYWARKGGMILWSYLPLCLFDVLYVEGRGETKFWEPLWMVAGPRCESDSLRPTTISGRGGGEEEEEEEELYVESR